MKQCMFLGISSDNYNLHKFIPSNCLCLSLYGVVASGRFTLPFLLTGVFLSAKYGELY